MPATIPVVCDRCRTAGTAGTGDFSHYGDLLEFEPVPVGPRINGWDADAQRAFIALVATTGSKRRAALGIGRNVHGIEQLVKRGPEADAFRAALDRAFAIARQNGAVKLATGLADTAARQAHLAPPSRLIGHPPEEEGAGGEEESQFAMLDLIFHKFARKIDMERTARLAGEVVAADYYLRQMTVLEIALDLASERVGEDSMAMLGQLRRANHDLFEIAETTVSRSLDTIRRRVWIARGDLPRPDPTPDHYLVPVGDGVPIHAGEYDIGGPEGDRRKAERAARYREEAEKQIEWEARSAESRTNDGEADASAWSRDAE